MARVLAIQPENANPSVKQMYEKISDKLGTVPNIFKNMANSPHALQGYLALSEQANNTSLPAKLRSQISLLVAEYNNCNYCLSAHTAISKSQGLSEKEILQARQSQAANAKESSILQLTHSILKNRGHVSEEDIQKAKREGISDQQILELILLITLNIYTNYCNNVTGTTLDFPAVADLNEALQGART